VRAVALLLAFALMVPAAAQAAPGRTGDAADACYARSTADCLCWPAAKLEATAVDAKAWRDHECVPPPVTLFEPPGWLVVVAAAVTFGIGFGFGWAVGGD